MAHLLQEQLILAICALKITKKESKITSVQLALALQHPPDERIFLEPPKQQLVGIFLCYIVCFYLICLCNSSCRNLHIFSLNSMSFLSSQSNFSRSLQTKVKHQEIRFLFCVFCARHLLDLIPINSLFAPNYLISRVFPTAWGGRNIICVLKYRFIGSQGTQLVCRSRNIWALRVPWLLPASWLWHQTGGDLSPFKLKSGKLLQPSVRSEVWRKCEGKFS